MKRDITVIYYKREVLNYLTGEWELKDRVEFQFTISLSQYIDGYSGYKDAARDKIAQRNHNPHGLVIHKVSPPYGTA